jgi:FkbM family methyltransferase
MEYAEYVVETNKRRGITKLADMYVPIGSEHKTLATFRSAPDMQYAVQRCEQKRVAVQAGGCIGGWARWLATRFDAVYTFEPEAINFECLLVNIKSSNVHAMRAGLSDDSGYATILRNEKNATHHMTRQGTGDVPMVTIDSLRLKYCDLIVLDIEGFEDAALWGARQTIGLYSPVIMVQTKCHDFIEKNFPGYDMVRTVAHDSVYVRA